MALTVRPVTIERTGKVVHVRELPASQAKVVSRVFRGAQEGFGVDEQVAYLAASLCTADGTPLFKEPKDAEPLKDEPHAVISQLFLAALEVNGLTQKEVDREKKT